MAEPQNENLSLTERLEEYLLDAATQIVEISKQDPAAVPNVLIEFSVLLQGVAQSIANELAGTQQDRAVQTHEESKTGGSDPRTAQTPRCDPHTPTFLHYRCDDLHCKTAHSFPVDLRSATDCENLLIAVPETSFWI